MYRAVWTALLLIGPVACARDSVSPSPAQEEPGHTSRGLGGLTCKSTGKVTVNRVDYPYCVVQVGEAELKIVEPRPSAASGPLRLALYLHGDGAGDYTADTALKNQAPWASAHHVLYVAALAPNRCSWWTNRPATVPCVDDATDSERDLEGRSARALARVIDTLRGGWNLRDDILFGGSSGGAFFLAASFLPRYGDRYHGIYALGCGGEPPWTGHLDWNSADPRRLGRTRLFYKYGTRDPYVADIQRSIVYYQAQAFPLFEEVVPNAEHCAFDHLGWSRDIWARAVGG